MIGLILIFFVGRAFYNLANQFRKKPWLYVIIGIGSYYIGALTFSFLLGILLGIYDPELLDDPYNLLIGLAAIPVGVITCYLFYQWLKRRWSSRPKSALEMEGMISHFGEREADKNFE